MLVTILSLRAQEPSDRQRKAAVPSDIPATSQQLMSELMKDNLDRVSASAAQLKAVLMQNTGLLVELKRWIAKDASDSGQVLADEDLSDAAVFQRLAGDVKFRSVATRLVQKYGYLRPSVNPESDLAKQQEYVLKERAKRMVQVEAQEDQKAAQLETINTGNQHSTSACREGRRQPQQSGFVATPTESFKERSAIAVSPACTRGPAAARFRARSSVQPELAYLARADGRLGRGRRTGRWNAVLWFVGRLDVAGRFEE
jgi:hypothetical protein